MVTKTELKERAKKSAEEVIEEQKNGYPTEEDKREKAREVIKEYGNLNNTILNRSRTAGLKRVGGRSPLFSRLKGLTSK